ncbi:hypothetical protein FJT64_008863 [Amphibalanus amphitrite]|uniref:Uncharacterized protein n=1 Tax=Amphibalanus amphitrite TaxID=1232801 RepID=A0A6A4VV42_AMPAM|nr:hypothetical protein FJT64_008863 [Amphibalanus amphitrite]
MLEPCASHAPSDGKMAPTQTIETVTIVRPLKLAPRGPSGGARRSGEPGHPDPLPPGTGRHSRTRQTEPEPEPEPAAAPRPDRG